jgi:ABC-3C biological conflict system middle component
VLLPTKGVSADRALITIGSDVLSVLRTPTSVTGAWERFNRLPGRHGGRERITFDWFSLALATLFAVGAIDWTGDGLLRANHVSP